MIQIDMPMPTNCLDCPACNEYLMCAIPVNGRGWGENDVREFGQGRPEWCPMKEQTKDQEIVRCKDCRKGTVLDEYYVKCNLYKAIHAPMFHCADGERRGQE